VSTLLANTTQRVVAVASRTAGKAAAFAAAHAIDVHLSSYEELVARDDVDAVYVANQPTDHYAGAMLALDAGKPVLVEKPFTKSVAEAAAIFARARQLGIFVMEAMWTRYLPQMDVARQLLESGAIGEPRLVLADFCQDNRAMARMWRKGHGSPLWDMGIYPIALCQMIFGEPSAIETRGIVLDDGMDAETTAYLTYAGGARAAFTVSGVVDAPHHATIAGEEGVIEFAPPFVFPTAVGLAAKGFDPPMQWWVDDSHVRRHAGLAYQATAFADYVGRGLIASPLQSHADSLACLRVATEITRRLGADPY
jgi:predicted dehydrogenase